MGFSVISHKHKPGSKKSPKCHRILFFLFAQRSLLSHSAQRRKKLSAFRCHLILQHHQSTVSSSRGNLLQKRRNSDKPMLLVLQVLEEDLHRICSRTKVCNYLHSI
ncbi:PREDICTED: uncharacterized protein LOC104604142 isoform X2 [Nelumbo nucifera]|uniref:Uncharacterized protein LOC104604142 isoform X2 n=1 Tax=Nelumbo nucifera TaxID=4432 RepID=A0A1U8AUT6_NELNU|nr:PREDICTED: uncharacterized protein LOC104604142 isoform X2 [Nelumbo nucifera]